jgi:cellulose synthase/poly-beta-1,6-N-acetylglucosamine synthase-like glycosyltransferase
MNEEITPVSIIICSKNNIEFLKRNLNLVMEQDYANFELIVVNDGSWDGTKDFLDQQSMDYSNLRAVHLDKDRNHMAGKKFALTMGIKAATNEHLLLIDADCAPVSKNWIRSMMSKFEDGKDIVLGFSPYKKYFGLLNLFIRYETLYVGMHYLSFAMKGKTYMGVGRNLAYKKSLFLQNKGFAKHINIAAGDDDLFVQAVANADNTKVCIDPDSFTLSEPHRKVGEWWNQKKRHLSVGSEYKSSTKVLLGVYNISFLLFYLLLISAIFISPNWEWIILIYGIRMLILWIVTILCFAKLKDVFVGFLFPILDVFYFLYYIILGPISMSKNKSKW